MEHTALVNLLTEKAMGYLRYDDANPNVGWGMSITRAVELAEKATLTEAARWNSIEALRLDFSSVKEEVITKVRDLRR